MTNFNAFSIRRLTQKRGGGAFLVWSGIFYFWAIGAYYIFMARWSGSVGKMITGTYLGWRHLSPSTLGVRALCPSTLGLASAHIAAYSCVWVLAREASCSDLLVWGPSSNWLPQVGYSKLVTPSWLPQVGYPKLVTPSRLPWLID